MPVLLLMVGAGGMVGTWARYSVARAVARSAGPLTHGALPRATLLVNVLGSFCLGLLLPPLYAHSGLGWLNSLVTVGCLGAFTTFSSFASEIAALLMHGYPARAAAYAAVSVIAGLCAMVAGLTLSAVLW